MGSSTNKTVATDGDVAAFLNGVEPERKREDSRQIAEWMREISGEEPVMWGSAMIGFGEYHYRYDSGREGDFIRMGFSPRKANISLHLLGCYVGGKDAQIEALFEKLGKHKRGASCVYINKLADVDEQVLKQLMKASWDRMAAAYPE